MDSSVFGYNIFHDIRDIRDMYTLQIEWNSNNVNMI